MRSAKRAARVREVQERLLQVRVSELEEAARRREAVHQARDAWSGRLMEAAAPARRRSRRRNGPYGNSGRPLWPIELQNWETNWMRQSGKWNSAEKPL